MVRAFFTKIIKKGGIVRERLILRKPICCFLVLKGPRFLISSWKTGTNRAARSSQDWGHEAEQILRFLSVTFYFSVKLRSLVPISNTWIVFWPHDYCYSLSYYCYASGYGVFHFTIFCLKLPCITIYKHTLPWIKHPSATRNWGLPHPSFLHLLFIDSCPQVLVRQEHHNRCISKSLSLHALGHWVFLFCFCRILLSTSQSFLRGMLSWLFHNPLLNPSQCPWLRQTNLCSGWAFSTSSIALSCLVHLSLPDGPPASLERPLDRAKLWACLKPWSLHCAAALFWEPSELPTRDSPLPLLWLPTAA